MEVNFDLILFSTLLRFEIWSISESVTETVSGSDLIRSQICMNPNQTNPFRSVIAVWKTYINPFRSSLLQLSRSINLLSLSLSHNLKLSLLSLRFPRSARKKKKGDKSIFSQQSSQDSSSLFCDYCCATNQYFDCLFPVYLLGF